MQIDSNNCDKFYYFILGLIAISFGLNQLLSKGLLYIGIQTNIAIETPSILAIYTILFKLFDKYWWKFSIFKKLGIIVADDLNGKWVGTAKSSYDDFQSDITTELDIRQTATKIKIYGKFNQSKSESIQESFGKSEIDDEVALYYFFRNEPNYNSPSTMAMHEGCTKLIYHPENHTLSGYYYSGRNRNNHGTITVKKSNS